MKSCLPGDHRLIRPILRQLHADEPVITSVKSLFLDEECDYLVEKAAEAGLHASETTGNQGESVVDEYRTSRTAVLPGDAVIDCLRQRLATIAGMPSKNLEPLQVTEYGHGQLYKAHYDDIGEKPRRLK